MRASTNIAQRKADKVYRQTISEAFSAKVSNTEKMIKDEKFNKAMAKFKAPSHERYLEHERP